MNHEQTYARVRADVLARHFALGKFWRANHFTNVNLLGELGGTLPRPGEMRTQSCFTAACVPRRAPYRTDPASPVVPPTPVYDTPDTPGTLPNDDDPAHGICDMERWRVWTHDHTNGLKISGLRLIHLCIEHRLGQPQAAKIIAAVLDTTGAMFKYPDSSAFGGYALRWDPVADDDWEIEIDSKGVMTPILPCRFLLNTDLKGYADQRYLYCTPLDDPRYRRAVEAGIANSTMGKGQDRFRRWEPSKDEYIGLLAGLSEVFDTFSGSTDPAHVAITNAVKVQCGRIARYLRDFGYLLVRPCGGVTARGAGEILPLLEFAFKHVFRRILGEEFSSSVSYAGALAAAGIRVPTESAGSAGLNLLTGIQEFANWIHDNTTGHFSDRVNDLVGNIDAHRQSELVRLWRNRQMIDAVDIAMQGEVLLGMVFNGLPRPLREKQYRQWLRTRGREIADAFKPYIALMLLHDDRRSVEAYLDWFDASFTHPETPNLADGANDWSFAVAVAMLAARELGDDTRRTRYTEWLEKRLNEMRQQIHDADPQAARDRPGLFAVIGAGSAPSDDHESDKCTSDPPRVVVSEYHDKVGNWYGYMPALGLAWRHLLDGAPPFSPASEISLPTPDGARGWPEPAVPVAVILEAKERPDRMPVPLRAISRSDPNPDGQHDVPLFRDPPARPHDNDLGRPPRPVGTTATFDIRGGMTRRTETRDFDYPLPASIAADASNWTAAPAFDISDQTLVERWNYRIEGARLHLEVVLRAVAVERGTGRFGVPVPRFRYARFSGTVSLAWVRQL